MQNYLQKLRLRHRNLDRLIDTSKAAGKQDRLAALKRLRLRMKDTIAETEARTIAASR
ncbi:MAG: hypothetical protein WA948_01065 [Pontixanthobacter sp.]